MASKMGYMRFLRHKMAHGGYADGGDVDEKKKTPQPVSTPDPVEGPESGMSRLSIAGSKKIGPKKGYFAEGGEVPEPEAKEKWGEIGGDPGYGQPTHRHNSTGEPHTNQYFSDEHPMEYMSDGGMVSHYNHDEPNPDPDHHMQDMSEAPDLEWHEQMGEPYPDLDDPEQETPDIAPHPVSHDQIHAQTQLAHGGMAYHEQPDHDGELEHGQEHPDMDHEDAMAHEMANFAKGGYSGKAEDFISSRMHTFGKGKMHSGSKHGPEVSNPKQAVAIAMSEARKKGMKVPGMAKGGMAHKHAFAHALKKGMRK